MSKTKKEAVLGYLFLLPSLALILLLIGYPMINNFIISFKKVPLNPKLEAKFIGLENYISVFSDTNFFTSLLTTVLFTAVVVVLSTSIGLGVAMLFNREFRFKKICMALIILPYVVPSIALIFAYKYMFNNLYGPINYLLVDVFKILETAPLWFDNKNFSFVVVVIFAVWKFFPYAYLSFYAILQSIDKSYYEAAQIDGASFWDKFIKITIPEIKPVLITVITLRTIWVFYMFTEVYLLTKQVNIIGVYLYDSAFAVNDLGKASSISIILFLFLFIFIVLFRKRK